MYKNQNIKICLIVGYGLSDNESKQIKDIEIDSINIS